MVQAPFDIGGGEISSRNTASNSNHNKKPAAMIVTTIPELEEPHNMKEMYAVGEGEAMLLPLLADVLKLLAARNDKSHGTDQALTAFHALQAPEVDLLHYIERIRKYSECSPCCFVIALVLMDRYLVRNPTFVLSSFSVHRILLTSVMVASKFLDDFYYNNAHWAKLGGVRCAELNILELELLFKIRFNLHVQREEYCKYRGSLLLSSSQQQQIPKSITPSSSSSSISSSSKDCNVKTKDTPNTPPTPTSTPGSSRYTAGIAC